MCNVIVQNYVTFWLRLGSADKTLTKEYLVVEMTREIFITEVYIPRGTLRCAICRRWWFSFCNFLRQNKQFLFPLRGESLMIF